jgi:hypothetical protein
MSARKGTLFLGGLVVALAIWAAVYGRVALPAPGAVADEPLLATLGRSVTFAAPLAPVTGLAPPAHIGTATPTPTVTGTIYQVVTRGAVLYVTPHPLPGKRNLATLIFLPPAKFFVTDTPTITPPPYVLPSFRQRNIATLIFIPPWRLFLTGTPLPHH